MIRKRYWWPALIAALFLAACQGVAVDENDITGIYYLSEIDGIAVPGTVSHDGQPMEVRSGSFIISGDGMCYSKTIFVSPGGEEITREVRAHYTVKDSRLIMTWEGAGISEGTVKGDIFTMDNHGMIMEYEKPI